MYPKLVMTFRTIETRRASLVTTDPVQANTLFGELLAVYQQIRADAALTESFLELLTDPDPQIRATSAAMSLEFAPDRAVAVLDALRLSQERGLWRTAAEYTLREWREGHLKPFFNTERR